MSERTQVDVNDSYLEKYGFHVDEKFTFKTRRGLDAEVVKQISAIKNEPGWMTDFRLRAHESYASKPMPNWGSPALQTIQFDDIYYYIKPTEEQAGTWEDLPAEIKNTYDKLGIPEAEKKYLAGVGAQYECLTGDARVWTARGPVPIRDILPGDDIFSFDETASAIISAKVRATAAKGEREVFEVRARNRVIRATGNHPFLTLTYDRAEGKQRGRYKREWKYLRDLQPGDLVAVAKKLPDMGQSYPMAQPAIKTHVVGRNQTGVEYDLDISRRYTAVELPETDCAPRTELVRATESLYGVKANTSDPYRVSINSTILARTSEANGFARDARYFHGYTSAKGTTFRKHTNAYLGFVKIDSIVPAGTEQVYDIEVDGPHNFVAEGLIVHNSEVIYHNLAKDLAEKGVIFLDTDTALREQPELFRQYFGTIIPYADNKFAALNSAVWSGGSFIYVPPGVKIDMPLQAYFRINAKNVGQFERTLIIVDEGAQVHYVEGCFQAGARVRTRHGEKAIETIQKGDEVLTHRGRYRRVYKTMRRPYRGTIYTVRYFGDSRQELRVTDEHPLLVVRRESARNRNKDFSPEWLPVSQVKPGDYLAIPIPQPETIADEAVRTVAVPIGGGRRAPVLTDVTLPMEPGLFRLLGYYHAEGHADQEHYLSFAFNVNETAYLDDTRALIQQYFGKAPIENRPRQNGQSLVVCSTRMARTFARQYGSTVDDKRVPEHILNAPLARLREWVRGVWRGDGSYDPRKNMFRYNTVSRDLAYAFRDALLRLGIASSVNYQERETPRRPMYTVVISSPHNAAFGEIVGRDAPGGSLSGSPFEITDQYMFAPIRSIEIEEAETTVYNFSVEEDESYVCEGVVSHNCTAPIYSSDSLHSAVVEIIVKKGGRCRYTTIQNWSTNVYNLVTKRAVAYQDATMEWVDGNLGCLAEGSTVTTPAGLRTIESLEVGDQVLSYDENTGQLCFRAVTAKRYSGQQRVHTVSAGERALQATSNHPFYSLVADPAAPKESGRIRPAYVRADRLTHAIVPSFAAVHVSRPASQTAATAAAGHAYPPFSQAMPREWDTRHAALELPAGLEVVDVDVSEASPHSVPTWDIEVEGTGNFVSQGFIVHNSKLTMKYPAVYLMEPGAHGEILSIAFAGKGQHQDAGGKVVHAAPRTTSKIVSKSISKDGGRASYRGLLKVHKNAAGSRSNVVCDALLLDERSRSDTYPYIEIDTDDVSIGHEASVSKIGEEQLFYAQSRGLSEEEASSMVVSGFIEPLVKELPMEYAVEMNRLIALQMEGTVG